MAKQNPVPKRTDDCLPEHMIQAQFALAAFSTIKAENLVYVSVPITSGPRLYEYMHKMGFKTPDEAKKDHDEFFKHVVQPNLADGVRESEAWTHKINGAVVAPAEFEKRLRGKEVLEWGQDDFMGMWIPLIDEKITDMVMLNGWEYSNGSGEEYLQAVLMQMGRRPRNNMDIVDQKGDVLPLDKGIEMVANAYKHVTSLGLKPRNMAETLSLLLEAEERFAAEQATGRAPETRPNEQRPGPNVPAYDSKKVETIRREMLPRIAKDFPDIQGILERTSSFDYSPINALFRKKPSLNGIGLQGLKAEKGSVAPPAHIIPGTPGMRHPRP
jgi:hypothetical protein